METQRCQTLNFPDTFQDLLIDINSLQAIQKVLLWLIIDQWKVLFSGIAASNEDPRQFEELVRVPELAAY